MGTRAGALSYLAWRALVAHPLRRLFHRRGTGLQRFHAAYVTEGLGPTTPEDRAIGEAASACVACGLCELGCDLAGAAPAVRALGVHAVFRLYSRSGADLPLAADALAACEACVACEALCPTGVPIRRIVRQLRGRILAGAGEARPPGRDG